MADSKSTDKAAKTSSYKSALRHEFRNKMIPELKDELKLGNINQVPRIEKISINVGLGRAKDDKRLRAAAANTLFNITGQKPIETMAKKSIAGFKIRAGQNKIGIKVTLRGDRMFDFLSQLIHIVLPRLRDFHGVSTKAFDGKGNYSIGLKEQSIFPELSFEDTNVLHGLQINIVTTTDDNDQARALLAKLGMPFEKENK
jgi:large subunit ribosomal protein L5